MTRDWLRWHADYDTAGSSLSRRLRVVQDYLERALTEAPADPDGHRRLISLCAGDGRDMLPVLARHDQGRTVRAVLAELDPELTGRARTAAAELDLPGVDVRTGDAGRTETYLDAAPAHVLLACGVFGNITTEDVRRTIAALSSLMVSGGIVIWTRGRGDDNGPDPSAGVAACFTEHGFHELAFTRPPDARFRAGMHRLARTGSGDPPDRLFTFVP
ncbi:hypothetical protein Ait01nite_025960 [Actinoplanes italicus]|uniref:Methyltransferase n=1 Tax=Actinoplanes italicus TaxID=113567 RepID=A0A2T0KF75_9ACTN|nr:class I SAM-dependent methyltransferase [Actinoplanes italicus]PRX22030.1 hypothetical protein CLV67_105207 [Actinoplanes italicus]GIE29551.1 hypothetical protein Ait01nite_025960 [Actinoplanes italicus]